MKQIKYILTAITVVFILYIIAVLTYISVEPKAYDFMIKNVSTKQFSFDKTKNVYGHEDIVLVLIDNDSVGKYRWPWKRELNNKIFNYFQEYAKPKVFVYDYVFTTPDIDNPQSDKNYFSTIKKFHNFVGGFILSPRLYENEKDGIIYDNKFLQKYEVKNIELKTEMPVLYRSTLMSPDEYLNSTENLGFATIVPGFFDGNWTVRSGDSIYRTQELLVNYKGSILPSLAMKSYLVAENSPKIIVDDEFIIFPESNYNIRYIKTPIRYILPIKFYKHYDTGYAHKKYSAIDIIDSYDAIKSGRKPKINPEEFKDKYVIYGAHATEINGINDTINTSVAVNDAGPDVQATCLDNIVHKDFLTVVPSWVNFLITILSMIFVYYTIRTHILFKAVSYAILIILLTLALSVCCFYYGVVINVVTPAVMCVITMILAYIHRYTIENKNKEKVESAMGKFMSEDVMRTVIKNIDNLGLGGKKGVVTVLFSDIRGFTSMSENMSAQEVSELLNEYFSEMEPIVSKYNGIINKFIGDAIMAVFGEPIADKAHPLNAVKCGYEMLQKVEELDEKWQKSGKPVIKIGIGINTGEVFIGNIGSEKRMEYTVIGDTVNLASRLESYNKTFNTNFLISSTTFEHIKDFVEVKKISDVEIRGKAHKMDIYEVINIRQQ